MLVKIGEGQLYWLLFSGFGLSNYGVGVGLSNSACGTLCDVHQGAMYIGRVVHMGPHALHGWCYVAC
jgi:hypothetical protein